MNDREKLLALFAEFGLTPYSESRAAVDNSRPTPAVDIVGLGDDRGDEKVANYSGFYCEFQFLPDGSFYRVGIWE